MESRRKRFWDPFGFEELFGFDEIFQRMQEYIQKAAESGELSENSLTIPFEGPNFKGIIKYEYSNLPINEQDIEFGLPFPEELEPTPRKAKKIISEKSLQAPVQDIRQDPLVDIIENPDELIIVAEVPAANKEDIKLNLTEKNLEIRVDSPTMFYKAIQLPCTVDCDSAKANFKNRILEIKIKKK
jgi:HSP20 family molecular chaperone IbpA